MALALACATSLAACADVLGLSGYENGEDVDAALDASLADADGGADSGAPDGAEADTATADSGTDTIVTDGAGDAPTLDSADADATADAIDAAPPDTATTDTADGAPDAVDALDGGETGVDAADAGPCSTVRNVGLSEIMVRAISSSGDTHEWFELTNYDSTCSFDVGGLRVTTQSWSTTTMTFIGKANVTVPAGLRLAPGASLLFADVKATFLADASAYVTTYGLDPALVLDLNWTLGDLFVNGADNAVDVYYPGASLPSESVTIKARGTTWPAVGRAFEFPASCDPSLRLLAGSPVTTSTHWVDTSSVAAEQFGTITATSLYGTPGRRNDLPATCP